MDNLTNSLVSGLTTTQGDILDAIGSVLPVVLVVVGAFIVINVGIKFFRRYAK